MAHAADADSWRQCAKPQLHALGFSVRLEVPAGKRAPPVHTSGVDGCSGAAFQHRVGVSLIPSDEIVKVILSQELAVVVVLVGQLLMNLCFGVNCRPRNCRKRSVSSSDSLT